MGLFALPAGGPCRHEPVAETARVRYTFRFGESRVLADLPTAYPLRELFDVAAREQNVRLTCLGCGHACVASGTALWWLFHSRGWKDDFRSVARRCVCTMCWFRLGRKIRGPRFELVRDEAPTLALPMPSELEWKRELRHRR